MCDFIADSFTGEILVNELEAKIPEWFTKHDSKLLLSALENGELENELEQIEDLVEAKVTYVVKDVVKDIFRNSPKHGLTAEELNIKNRTIDILGDGVAEIKLDRETQIGDYEGKIANLTRELERLKKEMKKK